MKYLLERPIFITHSRFVDIVIPVYAGWYTSGHGKGNNAPRFGITLQLSMANATRQPCVNVFRSFTRWVCSIYQLGMLNDQTHEAHCHRWWAMINGQYFWALLWIIAIPVADSPVGFISYLGHPTGLKWTPPCRASYLWGQTPPTKIGGRKRLPSWRMMISFKLYITIAISHSY